MEVSQLGVSDSGQRYLKLRSTGASPAIQIPHPFSPVTVEVSEVADGSVTVEYSLDSEEAIQSDQASWHATTHGSITSSGGLVLDAPITHLRVAPSDDATTSVLEVLK